MRIVVNAKNGPREFACEDGGNVLHAGLGAGVPLPYECATGTCGTCKARLVSGRLESLWPGAPGTRYCKAEGEVLTCQSVARADCVLETGVTLKAIEPIPAPPRRFAGILRDGRRLTHDVIAFDVDLDDALDFAAGQFALLSVPGIPGARAYSMVNFDPAARRLAFVVKKKPGGGISEWLFGADVAGARLGVLAPLGHATFHAGTPKHVLCIAGGSGIAGMMSILALAVASAHFRAWDGHVFFGVRTAADAFFLDELEAFRARCPERLSITIALSEGEVPETLAAAYPGFTFGPGFVHAVAGEAMKGRFAGVRAWVAGPPPMVDASLRLLLREARLPPADIRYDKFS
jgi:toluene monooxygenase electron transfer component